MLELNRVAKQYYSATNTFGYLRRSPASAIFIAAVTGAAVLYFLYIPRISTPFGLVAELLLLAAAGSAAVILAPYMASVAQLGMITHFNRARLVPKKTFSRNDYELAKKAYLERLLCPQFGSNLAQALESIDKSQQIGRRNPLIPGDNGFAHWVYNADARGRITTLLTVSVSVAFGIFLAGSRDSAAEFSDRIFSVITEPSYWAAWLALTLMLALLMWTSRLLGMSWQLIFVMNGAESYVVRVLINDCYRYAFASKQTLKGHSKPHPFEEWSVKLVTRIARIFRS